MVKKKISKKNKENLEFARRTEETWKNIDGGKFTIMEFDKFIKMLSKL